MPTTIKAVADEFLKLSLSLNLWARCTRCNDDTLERFRLGKFSHKLCRFRQDLRVFVSYGQNLDERQNKGSITV